MSVGLFSHAVIKKKKKKTWAVLSQITEDKCADTPNQQET